MIADIDLMSRGMACLVRELGIVEAEAFISYIKTERFDYTKWREDQFDDMSLKDLEAAASKYEKAHPFVGKAKVI